MQPSHTWAGFKERQPGADVPQGADLEAQLAASIKRLTPPAAVERRGRRPVAASAPSVGDLLLQAIAAMPRRGKQSRDTIVREMALVEALGALLGGVQ